MGNAAMCHGVNKIQKNWKLQDSESRNSEFRIQETGPGNFRIQNSGNWISEFRIGKLHRETSEFRKLQNSESETGPGNFKIQKTSEFRKLEF